MRSSSRLFLMAASSSSCFLLVPVFLRLSNFFSSVPTLISTAAVLCRHYSLNCSYFLFMSVNLVSMLILSFSKLLFIAWSNAELSGGPLLVPCSWLLPSTIISLHVVRGPRFLPFLQLGLWKMSEWAVLTDLSSENGELIGTWCIRFLALLVWTSQHALLILSLVSWKFVVHQQIFFVRGPPQVGV